MYTTDGATFGRKCVILELQEKGNGVARARDSIDCSADAKHGCA